MPSAPTSRRRPQVRAPRRSWPWRPFPLWALLVAAWPVLFLFAENIAEVQLRDVIPPLGRALIAASLLLLIAALLFRDIRRGALVSGALVIAWFGYGHVDELVAPLGATRDIQLGGWAFFLVLAIAGAVLLPERWLARITAGLDVVVTILVLLSVIQVAPVELSRSVSAAEAPTKNAGDRPTPPPGSRDVWYFVFDRYGSNPSLEDLGGFKSDLPDWLESKGFYVARDAHANYGRTAMSLAATLNLEFLDKVAAEMGPTSKDATPVNEMLQDHLVGRFFQERGYRYVHLGSWFGATKTVRIADENPTLDTATDFEVMLDQTTFAPTLASLQGVPAMPQHHVLHREAALFDLRELERIRTEPGPKFVMAHLLLPHEPYVFDEFGDYPSREQRLARGLDDSYRRQMIFTNDHIKSFVDELLDGIPEDKQPIIIITADEGPYPDGYANDQAGYDWGTADPATLEIKYGILTAMYLPGPTREGALEPYDTMSSINTFPVALSHYWDGDWKLFPDRSWTSAGWYKPYDLTDVTDRLPPPYGKGDPAPREAPSPNPDVTPGPTPVGAG
ncbi:MAG: hypothetical protein U0869_09405 [Chloroflexota bacterium]